MPGLGQREPVWAGLTRSDQADRAQSRAQSEAQSEKRTGFPIGVESDSTGFCSVSQTFAGQSSSASRHERTTMRRGWRKTTDPGCADRVLVGLGRWT